MDKIVVTGGRKLKGEVEVSGAKNSALPIMAASLLADEESIIENVPVYPGCKGTNEVKKKCMVDKITKHVNRKYNTGLAGDLGLSPGKKRVYVQFKISKTGDIVDVRARGPHARLEKEAVRVVELLPKMEPGKQRGRPVGVKYTLPITLLVE